MPGVTKAATNETDNLPAASGDPAVISEPLGAVVYWWNVRCCEREYEEFSSVEEAHVSLDEWKGKYPWNTYYLAEVVRVQFGNGKYPQPFGYTVSQGSPDGETPQAKAE